MELVCTRVIRSCIYRILAESYKAEVKVSRRNETEQYLIPRAYTTLNQHGVP